MNIDWEAFKEQREYLIALANSGALDTDMLDGIINLMDAIQDEFETIGEIA